MEVAAKRTDVKVPRIREAINVADQISEKQGRVGGDIGSTDIVDTLNRLGKPLNLRVKSVVITKGFTDYVEIPEGIPTKVLKKGQNLQITAGSNVRVLVPDDENVSGHIVADSSLRNIDEILDHKSAGYKDAASIEMRPVRKGFMKTLFGE
jgi:hypothetical protein